MCPRKPGLRWRERPAFSFCTLRQRKSLFFLAVLNRRQASKFIHSRANNYALKAKRRTLAAMDVVEAMKDMEFEAFVEPLKAALAGTYPLFCKNRSLGCCRMLHWLRLA